MSKLAVPILASILILGTFATPAFAQFIPPGATMTDSQYIIENGKLTVDVTFEGFEPLTDNWAVILGIQNPVTASQDIMAVEVSDGNNENPPVIASYINTITINSVFFDIPNESFSIDAVVEGFDTSGNPSDWNVVYGLQHLTNGQQVISFAPIETILQFDPSTIVITDDYNDNLTIKFDETVIVDGAFINGNIKVKGGTLVVKNGGDVNGNIDVKKGGNLILENSSVNGNVSVKKSNSVIITDSQINGNVDLKKNQDVAITGNNIDGNLKISGTTGDCVGYDSSNNVSGNAISCPEPPICESDPTIDPTELNHGDVFTITDSCGRIQSGDSVFFDVITADNISVSADGTTISGNVPLGVSGDVTVTVRSDLSSDPRFNEIIVDLSTGTGTPF